MGSVVEFRCGTCSFSTEKLSVGWGKAGRASFWGGLAHCDPCKQLGVVDLAARQVDHRDRRCARCNGPLTLFEGTSVSIPCPRCSTPMHHVNLGTWT